MLGFVEIQVVHKKLEQRFPMDLVCMTCMEIFGSGLQIGMGVHIRTVVRGVIQVLTVCFVVVAGTTPRAPSGRRAGAAASRRTATSISVFDFANS